MHTKLWLTYTKHHPFQANTANQQTTQWRTCKVHYSINRYFTRCSQLLLVNMWSFYAPKKVLWLLLFNAEHSLFICLYGWLKKIEITSKMLKIIWCQYLKCYKKSLIELTFKMVTPAHREIITNYNTWKILFWAQIIKIGGVVSLPMLAERHANFQTNCVGFILRGQILSPWLGDIVGYGIGLSYWLASPSPGLRIWPLDFPLFVIISMPFGMSGCQYLI
jgi:hypothetical protein